MTFPSRIFIDGGDPAESVQAKKRIGFLDGQTTNPTLVSKNPEVAQRVKEGKKFSSDEIYQMYKKIVRQISPLVWSVSIETYSDATTTADKMYEQGQKMYSWIPNAWIKFPTTSAGLKAASRFVKEGKRVNMTLCFSQEQAAAVYSATVGAKPGTVFVSPFVGRLDDRGEDGMGLIENILRMYEAGDGHAMVLTASVRTLDHHFRALQLHSPIITVPYKVFSQWADGGFALPEAGWTYKPQKLKPMPFQNLDLTKPWDSFDISHELTDKGIRQFSSDWNSLVK